MEYSVISRLNNTPLLETATPSSSLSVLFVTSDHSLRAAAASAAVTSSSASSNMTSAFFNPDQSPAYVIMRRLQTVLIPVICLLGIFGNVLAAGTFLSVALNKTSCCFYLASKSLNDIGFLVSLFVVWLYRLRVPLFTTPGVCQITVFLTYICGCLSVWFVVFITAENFVRLTQPRLVQRYCNVPTARRIVAGAVIASAIFYNFSIWTTGITDGPMGTQQCASLNSFEDIVMALTVIDTTLTLILPSILIFFLLVAIVFKSMESFERKKRLRSSSLQQQNASGSGGGGAKQKKRHTPEGKMTAFLFALSIIFLFLNLPTHTIRLKLLIQMYIQREYPAYADIILQRVFEILLYFNFSTNCLIYLAFGERFRDVFTLMYLARCCPKLQQQKAKKTTKKEQQQQAASGVTGERSVTSQAETAATAADGEEPGPLVMENRTRTAAAAGAVADAEEEEEEEEDGGEESISLTTAINNDHSCDAEHV